MNKWCRELIPHFLNEQNGWFCIGLESKPVGIVKVCIWGWQVHINWCVSTRHLWFNLKTCSVHLNQSDSQSHSSLVTMSGGKMFSLTLVANVAHAPTALACSRKWSCIQPAALLQIWQSARAAQLSVNGITNSSGDLISRVSGPLRQ